MVSHIIIIGAGGFGREVLGLINDINSLGIRWNVLGFLDDNLNVLSSYNNYPPVLGQIQDCEKIIEKYHGSVLFINAIADSAIRRDTTTAISAFGVDWATLIHPDSAIGLNTKIGCGVILSKFASIGPDSIVGDHVHINLYGSCGHDAKIGDFCTLSAHVDVNGNTTIDDGVFLGSHAVVLPKAKVGAWARVGASSLVLRNVEPEVTVLGVPARDISKFRF